MNAKHVGAQPTLLPVADSKGTSTGVAADKDALMGQLDQAAPTGVEPAIPQSDINDVSLSAARYQLAPVPMTQIITESRRLTSATTLVDLQGIEPIAEALLKTLAGKARTGRLDKAKALELLQHIVSLSFESLNRHFSWYRRSDVW